MWFSTPPNPQLMEKLNSQLKIDLTQVRAYFNPGGVDFDPRQGVGYLIPPLADQGKSCFRSHVAIHKLKMFRNWSHMQKNLAKISKISNSDFFMIYGLSSKRGYRGNLEKNQFVRWFWCYFEHIPNRCGIFNFGRAERM